MCLKTPFEILRSSFHIDNAYFKQKVDTIYPKELQLDKTYISDSEAPFLDLNLLMSNDKRVVFHFDTVNVLFLDGNVPRAPSYGAYISQLYRFARASSQVMYSN